MSELPSGATIGILGGGQLGRMLAMAAARLGFRTHIYEPAANPPAGDVAHALTTAAYDDQAALRAFAAAVDVITYEFENVPVVPLAALVPAVVLPHPRALETARRFIRAFSPSAGNHYRFSCRKHAVNQRYIRMRRSKDKTLVRTSSGFQIIQPFHSFQRIRKAFKICSVNIDIKLVFFPVDSPYTCSIVISKVIPRPASRNGLMVKIRIINHQIS